MLSSSKNKYEWLSGAIFPPELEWFKMMVISQSVDLLIECGRQDGASARWFFENLSNVEIFSVDLDDRPEVLENSRRNLLGTSVNAITGNVFYEVPKIIRSNPNRKIAIIEDAIKGWAGLSLLMSCIFYENVVLVAQHNNHIGHRTRTFWNNLSEGKAFLESDDNPDVSESLIRWASRNSDILSAVNRNTDHSSLALIDVNPSVRAKLIDNLFLYKKDFGHWDPIDLRSAHFSGLTKFVNRNFFLERYFPWTRIQR